MANQATRIRWRTRAAEAIRRHWSSIAHPRRRGAPNPATQQIFVAMIAVGAVVLAIDTLTAQTRKTPSGSSLAPNGGLFVAGLAIVGFGVLGIILLAVPAFFRWREDRITPFELFHDRNDPDCEEFGTAGIYSQVLRVGVRNRSSGGVQRVRVFMRILQGEGRSAFLHLEHDNEPSRFASRNGEYLTIDQISYFDVAFVRDLNGIYRFWFYYADADIHEASEIMLQSAMEWTIRLEAIGWTDSRDVVPLSKDFRLVVDDNHLMALTAVS